jgi:hypothetical protein
MVRLAALLLAILPLAVACTYPNAFSASDRQDYRANVCQQYLSPESTTPNLAGRGRSCVQQTRNQ